MRGASSDSCVACTASIVVKICDSGHTELAMVVRSLVCHADDVPAEGEIRMPFNGDVELTALVEHFVMSDRRYLQLLHGNYLGAPEEERSRFITALLADAREISGHAVRVLLGSEWRSRLTAAYLIAASRREQFVPVLGDLLVKSQFVYSGQGYCIALASVGTPAAATHLSAYLDRWLPDVEARYDQWWAMAALVSLDRRSGSNYSDSFLGAKGLWETWSQGRLSLESQVDLTDRLLSSLSGSPGAGVRPCH